MQQPTDVYSVSDINRLVKDLLEDNIPTIWLEGEVSNFKAHYSGHYYFTLKDAKAQISAVMWRSRAAQVSFKLEDGLKIRVLGNIRVYEKSGRYQIDIIRMQPAGVGDLQQQFEALKNKLNQEGLFDPDHKLPLPKYPKTIGVITSGTGAAIRDILDVLHRRAPQVNIIVRPAKVQGQGAAEDIARAIEQFNRFGGVEILIVGRGGGSLEDLWAFNEEVVARAIYDCKIPIISAVGHEIDFTISDFVADIRAATPSVAAELAVPDTQELKGQLTYFNERLGQLLRSTIENRRTQIERLENSYGIRRLADRLHQYAIDLDELHNRLSKLISNTLHIRREQLVQVSARLQNLDPGQVLRRGYSILYKDGKVITDTSMLSRGDSIENQLDSGRIESTVHTIKKD